jgi:hypothetical protein
MNERIFMRATSPFTLGAEDIGEGDLLKLTQAEATTMLQRGLVAPADMDRDIRIELRGRGDRWRCRVLGEGGNERAWGSTFATPSLALRAAMAADQLGAATDGSTK